MTIAADKLTLIERLSPHLAKLTEPIIDQAIETGGVLKDSTFHPSVDHPFGQFYAPFDWINEKADIVLIGITPGKRQARTALKTLRQALAGGRRPTEAAELAKQAASFEGDMRDIAAQLMDRFQLQRIFRLKSCSELFESAKHRAHYTSLLRYPILHWQTKRKNGVKISGWFDYSGGDDVFKNKLLIKSRETDFEREIIQFRNAWLVPFGPTPAQALERLAAQGVLDRNRILAGINHPSGTQWNRHYCQLNLSDDHSSCAKNVGCRVLRSRSKVLDDKVAAIHA
jgi:hypothetical protein